MLDVVHYRLHLVFAVDDARFHQLQGLADELELIDDLLKGCLHFWFELSICHSLDNLL